MPFYHMNEYNAFVHRRCDCGGLPEVIEDPVGDYFVRCRQCHKSTHAYMDLNDAISQWEKQDHLLPNADLIIDDLEKHLAGTVRYMAIERDGAECLNAQSCDCYELIVVTEKGMICMRSVSAVEIGFDELTSFSSEDYSLKILPPKNGDWKFLGAKYNDAGLTYAIKYQYGDRFLFIFASQHNLIVTKAIVDLLDSDDIPERDDSILFEG